MTSWLKGVASLLILGGLAIVGTELLSGREVVRAFTGFDTAAVPALLALGVAYPLVKAWRLVRLLRPLSTVPPARSVRAYLAGEGPALLPGGFMVRVGLLRSEGVPVASATPPVLLGSLLDQGLLLVGAVIASAWHEEARDTALTVIVVLTLLAVPLCWPRVRAWLARNARALSRRAGVLRRWEDLRVAFHRQFDGRTLVWATALTLVAMALKVVALDLCLRGLGWSLPPGTLVLTFVLPTLLARLSPIPAGVGVAEAGSVAFLVANTAVPPEEALAATALFRAVTVLFPALLGTVVYALTTGWPRNR